MLLQSDVLVGYKYTEFVYELMHLKVRAHNVADTFLRAEGTAGAPAPLDLAF